MSIRLAGCERWSISLRDSGQPALGTADLEPMPPAPEIRARKRQAPGAYCSGATGVRPAFSAFATSRTSSGIAPKASSMKDSANDIEAVFRK